MQEDMKQKREQVMASLASNRVGKTKLLKMLGNLKELEERGEPVDKALIVSLVNSFDALSRQEEEYIQKRLLDQIHKLETEVKARENGGQNAELAQLQKELLSQRISVDRAQEVRNRLRQEAFKRGYLRPDGTPAAPNAEAKIDPSERVPPLEQQADKPAESSTASQAELHEKIQRHIDQIKSRRQRMRECYAQAQEMAKLNETYANAKSRLSNLENMRERLEEASLNSDEKSEEKTEEKPAESNKEKAAE
ncbi:hypothetical protein M3Y99_00333300 [Aphelenchoides fujianensis]|nr:hypothetical protein M3Y99_00333300 [Aphelenchoides fujianensis]